MSPSPSYNYRSGPLISPEEQRKRVRNIRAWKHDYRPKELFNPVQNQEFGTPGAIYEPFNDVSAFDDPSFTVVATATEGFENLTQTQNDWTDVVESGSPVITYVKDPLGIRPGIVKRVRHNASAQLSFYASSIGGVDVTNIRSGRLSFYITTQGASAKGVFFRKKGTAFPLTNGYKAQAELIGNLDLLKVGDPASGVGMGGSLESYAPARAAGPDWPHFTLEWREKHWVDYGPILHIRWLFNGIPVYCGRNSFSNAPHFWDDNPSYPGGDGAERTYVGFYTITGLSTSETYWFDDIKIEKFYPDYVVEPGAV